MKKSNGEIKVKRYSPEEFANEFKALCDRMGYQLVATPQWLPRDDGTFSMKIVWSVGKLPKLQSVDKQQAIA